MKKIAYVLVAIAFSILLMAPPTENGRLRIALPYAPQGQRHWFVTASGTGDCLTWSTACTFRTAVSKCTDDYQDVIWLSPEDHDCDNGSDPTGTTIAAKNVRIVGISNTHSYNARLYNTAAVVTHVVQVTGHRVSFENIRFNQKDQTDIDIILLHTSAPRTNVIDCQFRSIAGAASDVAILMDNTSRYHYFGHVHFQDFADAAIRTNDVNNFEADELFIHNCHSGIDITHANDDSFDFSNVQLIENTTGITTAAGVNEVRFIDTLFVHNTTKVVDGGTYGGLHFIGTRLGHSHSYTYPANAGVTLTGGGAAWAQGNLIQIIPASTITTPFKITGFNIQSSTANNIYKIEFFYGEATGDNSLEIFEFVDIAGNFNPPPVNMGAASVVSNSYVGAKLASDSGGNDTAVITLNIEAL